LIREEEGRTGTWLGGFAAALYRASDSTQCIGFAFSVPRADTRLLLRLPKPASRRIMQISRLEYEAGNCGLEKYQYALAFVTAELQMTGGILCHAASHPLGSRARGLNGGAAAVDGGVANTI
jgi:hypothetical protein